MNLLFIADAVPMPDRTSADFRFSALMAMIAEKHEVFYYAIGEKRQVAEFGEESVERYRRLLQSQGIRIVEGGITSALRSRPYAAIVFEWYFPAARLIGEARVSQPRARVIIDSVDVVFNRFQGKARLTKAADDFAKARLIKGSELDVYDRSDVVITVTDADAALLHLENPRLATFTIPNIHPLQDPVAIGENHEKRLVFVGSFGHEPNVDAMIYFCGQILPLIVAAEPQVKLRIIGSSPTHEITALASDRIEVLGFVPDTKPFLQSSVISIAPLRFGGGMKGKIGEAMSFALPVVTTPVGIDGFGLEPGKDALVADDPKAFADAVIHLLRDREYLERIRMGGYRFIRDNYSDAAVRRRVEAFFAQLENYPLKRIPVVPLLLRRAKGSWDRNIGWRFK
jgi:glycosyltransferase involved in cell wall biosynthesis